MIVWYRIFATFFLYDPTDYFSDVSRRYACLVWIDGMLVWREPAVCLKLSRRWQHMCISCGRRRAEESWYRTGTKRVQKCDFSICHIDDCLISHFCHLFVRFRLSDKSKFGIHDTWRNIRNEHPTTTISNWYLPPYLLGLYHLCTTCPLATGQHT